MALYLSKSRYCNAVQCEKMEWLRRYKEDERDASVINESITARGDRVGDLAMGKFGDYVEIPYNDKDRSQMIKDTAVEMEKGTPVICEATFAYDGLFCSVDILKKVGDQYEIYEVKSTSEYKDKHGDDLAYQYYVLTKLGIPVSKVHLTHIDTSYERQGELDVTKLFYDDDKTALAISKFDEVDEKIKFLSGYMEQEEEPEKPLGRHCTKPYDCAFFKYCSRNLPKPNLFDLAGMDIRDIEKMYKAGMVSFESAEKYLKEKLEKKPDLKKAAKAVFQIERERSAEEVYIDKEKLRSYLSELTYPIYMLDFEYYRNPIPEYDGVHPNDLMTFQYSIHVIHEDGTLEHKEYLAEAGKDPRRSVAERLCEDLPKDATVMAYHKAAERMVLDNLGELFPDLNDHLMTLHKHIKDLETPFQEGSYYTKAMGGYSSIKIVLPALFPDDPELDYSNIDGVNKGDKASEAYMEMSQLPPDEQEKLRQELLAYCKLDTYAMVKLFQKLKDAVK